MVTERQKAFRQEYRSRIMVWYDGYLHMMEEAQIGYKPAAGLDLLNFSNGFKAGAAYYFKQAKPPAPPKKH